MKRTLFTLALLSLGCAAQSAPRRADPIPAALLCSGELASAVAEIADPKTCAAATRKRLARIQRTVLKGWQVPRDSKPQSLVQVQFTLDADGRPRNACVLGGKGGREAREALAALATFEPRTPLRRAERCALGQPLVISFATEREP